MIHRKDSILIDAIDLLDEGGIQGLTTRRLAERQEITEPAIYRQYKNKLDIILHIIGEYANYDEQIMNTIREMKMSPREALLFYVERYGEHYENYPAISTVMFSFDTYRYHDKTNGRMEKIYEVRHAFLLKIAETGIESGDFKGPFSAEEIAEEVQNLLFSYTHRWRTFGGFSLTEKLKSMLDKHLQMF